MFVSSWLWTIASCPALCISPHRSLLVGISWVALDRLPRLPLDRAVAFSGCLGCCYSCVGQSFAIDRLSWLPFLRARIMDFMLWTSIPYHRRRAALAAMVGVRFPRTDSAMLPRDPDCSDTEFASSPGGGRVRNATPSVSSSESPEQCSLLCLKHQVGIYANKARCIHEQGHGIPCTFGCCVALEDWVARLGEEQQALMQSSAASSSGVAPPPPVPAPPASPSSVRSPTRSRSPIRRRNYQVGHISRITPAERLAMLNDMGIPPPPPAPF